MREENLFNLQFRIMVDFMIYYKTIIKLKEKVTSVFSDNIFWVNSYNSYIRLMIINWAKLYGSNSECTHWKSIVLEIADRNRFKRGLLNRLKMSEDEWLKYWENAKAIRDKYVAHNELINRNPIPYFEPAYKSVLYLYKWMTKVYFPRKGIIYCDDIEEYIIPYIEDLDKIIDATK